MMKLYTKAQMLLQSLKNDESGQDLIEYAIVATVVVLAAVATKGSLSDAISTAASKLVSAIGTV